MNAKPSAATALLVIDAQHAFEMWDAAGKRRNQPNAIDRIADLLAAFRTKGAPIFHIRHLSDEPSSAFAPDSPGIAAQPQAEAQPGESVIVKRVNSGFIGTDLEAQLRAANIRTLMICGATTNHCVETTTRMAGNLGFDARLVRDAAWTYDRRGPDGELHRAEDIHAMTLANLHEEFARIVTTAEVVAALGRAEK
jgi:nicotinamidase-related amidase